jgi:hypothetical protein
VEPESKMLRWQGTGTGAFMLIALGALLLAHNLIPEPFHDSPLHAALILGSIGAGFGAIFAFGEGKRRWARVPAVFFGTLAAVAFFASWPWHWLGFGLPFWPLLLILVGLLVMRRSDRRLV